MWINRGKKVPLMSFQGGGYIPGLSSARFRGGLGSDIRKTQEDIQSQAEGLGKEQKQSGLWGGIGGMIGEWGVPALAAALAPVTGGTSLVAGAALKGVGKAAGQYAGEKLAGIDDPSIKASSTGLLGGQYDLLQETEDKYKQGALGRSVKAGAGTALTAGLGDYAQAHMGSEIGKGLKGIGVDIGKAGPGQVMTQAGTAVDIPTADTGVATDYFMDTLGFQEGGYAKEYQHGGSVPMFNPMSAHGAIDALMVENSLANSYEQMPETTSYTSRGPMRIELDPSVEYEKRRPAPVQDAKLSDKDLYSYLENYGANEFVRIFGKNTFDRLGAIDFNNPAVNIPKYLK
jgi:hypothetical protein